jgi:hypothetical protein
MRRLHTVFIWAVNTPCINAPFSSQQSAMDEHHPSFDRLLECARASTAHRAPGLRVQTAQDLQRVMGWSAQRMTNMKSRGVSKPGALEAEALLGCPASYVLDGVTTPHWMEGQRLIAGEAPMPYAVAHGVSQSPFEAVPLLDREQLLNDNRPELFRFCVPDDAMAPEIPAGTEVVWTTRRRIAPGRLLLLADSHQQLHVRRCHQGDGPGAWVAGALNSAYRAFRSDEPGVHVLAVYKGRLEPDDV